LKKKKKFFLPVLKVGDPSGKNEKKNLGGGGFFFFFLGGGAQKFDPFPQNPFFPYPILSKSPGVSPQNKKGKGFFLKSWPWGKKRKKKTKKKGPPPPHSWRSFPLRGGFT